jgi:hypothetical protein
MPTRPIERGQQPWNKELLIGQKKPLEPKHVWSIRVRLALQLRFLPTSESMGNHDSKIVDAGSVD